MRMTIDRPLIDGKTTHERDLAKGVFNILPKGATFRELAQRIGTSGTEGGGVIQYDHE